MGVTVTIGGVDKTSFIRTGSLSAARALNSRATCDFAVRANLEIYLPVVGEPVLIERDGGTLFGGFVWSVRTRRHKGVDLIEADITCVDNTYIADRRLAGERKWANVKSGAIVSAIVTADLDSEGVGSTFVTDGPDVETFEIAGYPTVTEALNSLAELTAMRWYIDEIKELRWFNDSTLGYDAPFDVTGGNITQISRYESLEEYANDIIVKIPQSLRASATEAFDVYTSPLSAYPPDGSRQQFGLVYPCASAPTINLVDYSVSPITVTAQTVGVQGVDTGKDWYWSQGSNWITQDSSGTPLPSTSGLEVTYVGIDALNVSSTNLAEMGNRAAVEGGSGKHSRSFDQAQQLTRAQAQASSDALLARLDSLPVVIEYTTSTYHDASADLLRPGMRQSVYVLGIDMGSPATEFIVRSVKFQDGERWPDHIWAVVELVGGPLLQDMPALLKSLGGGESVTVAATAADGGSVQIAYA